ncbi:RNA-binding S4 domain-containing protein [Phenylobacterium sp.]|uniref:RNA-binding S4 domain-containing protein n=1 Tax=Phenylobacterium sp. TaxID=1871053 RepID=UPI001210FF1E|nr:RNA-binding S4 domain-containing protein [Phenylobacterium sp.]TAL35065.1 MAG: RNA-binding S4 domain-containing protein [Phenylobacterium sp.]
MSEGPFKEVGACRADVWLWRARFFKTRALAAKFLEGGRVRLTRPGLDAHRIDKPARPIKVGDQLVFALGGRLIAVRVEAMGDRRGPAAEARALYSTLEES